MYKNRRYYKTSIKTLVACTLFLLLVSFSTVPAQTQNEQLTSLLDVYEVWVDDDFGPETPGWGIDHFATIQDGVDAVSLWGTVHVYPGFYVENVVIETILSLVGTDPATTIVDGNGSGDVFHIESDWVSISHLTLQNGGSYGKGIAIYGDLCNITNCVITNGNDIGVSIYEGNLCRIQDNYIVNNSGWGVYLWPSVDDTMIIDNVISYNDGAGIQINGESTGSVIQGNLISNNYGTGVTIPGPLQSTSCVTIVDNDINNNFGAGVQLSELQESTFSQNTIDSNAAGVFIINCKHLTIEDNTLSGNGFMFWGAELDQYATHIISDNTANGQPIRYYIDTPGIDVPEDTAQAILVHCDNATVYGQNFSDVDVGIQLAFSNGCSLVGNTLDSYLASIMLTKSSFNSITHNDVSNTGDFFGSILLSYSSQENTLLENTMHDNTVALAFWNNSNNNVIKNNDITDNYGGIAFEYIDGGAMLLDIGQPPWPSVDNQIYHNNFIDNDIQAYDEGYNQWDNGYPSGGNYWSDYNGTDGDGDGIGDTPYFIMGGSQDQYPFMDPIVDDIHVSIGGPYYLDIGEYHTFEPTITGGQPPYSLMWHWGDGSAGTAHTHAFPGNKDTTYNIALTVKDAEGQIGVGTAEVYVTLPTPNTVFLEKRVRHEGTSTWKTQVYAQVGDILNVKLVMSTIGTDTLNVSVMDEHTVEFAYINDSVSIEPYFYYPGDDSIGPFFAWNFPEVFPNSTIEITYDVQIISEFSGFAIMDGYAMDGARATAYLADEGKIGPGGFIATVDDYTFVRIRQDLGTLFLVDDNSWAPYHSIQEAIDAASEGDTVVVYPGVYQEGITIDKSLQLYALSKQAIIDGTVNITNQSSAIKVVADDVTIRGFTIRNAMKSGIYMDSSDSHIINNRIVNNGLEGVYLHSGENNMITDNTIMQSGRGIILNGKYNLVKRNVFRNNDVGVMVDPEMTANNIYQNVFSNNDYNAWDFNFFGNHWHGLCFRTLKPVGNHWDDHAGDNPYVYIMPYGISGVIVDLYPISKYSSAVSPSLPVELSVEQRQLEEQLPMVSVKP